jgi:hypothetical protein
VSGFNTARDIVTITNKSMRAKLMDISKQAFFISRTPPDLQKYVDEAYEYICVHPEMVKLARQKKEPYKTFVEELLPFATFCTWKYGKRIDVVCSLVPGTLGQDAIVTQLSTGIRHTIEITWPMDGKLEVQQGQQLNEYGITSVTVWDGEDIAEHRKAIDRVFQIAHKKALRDYRFPGGSTLIFVFDEEPLFWKDNSKHINLLDSLVEQLKRVEFKVDSVLLMLMPKKRIVIVKSDESMANDMQSHP